MMINGTKYGFSIYPSFGKVQAEIYKISKFNDGQEMQISLLNKDFGSIFRTPNEKDYIKAREWCDLQMKCILKANQVA